MEKQPREEVGKPHKNRVTVPSHVPGAPLVMLAVSVWFSGGLLYS